MPNVKDCPGFKTFDADIKATLKTPPVYAFREIKAHENQVFPCIVGGQVGQTIQSLPKQASKCVENNP